MRGIVGCLLLVAATAIPIAAGADICNSLSQTSTLCDVTFNGDSATVNTWIRNGQLFPSVARFPTTGAYVVAWQSEFQDGSLDGIYASVFDSSGHRTIPEFRVNNVTEYSQRLPKVAVVGNTSTFVVTWVSENQDGSAEGVFARFFSAVSGSATTAGDIPVTVTTAHAQLAPAVASLSDSTVVVAWQSDFQDGSLDGIYARRLSATTGAALGSEIAVNVFTNGSQRAPAVASLGDDTFVVAWESYGQDGSGGGVYARRFQSATGVAIGTTDTRVHEASANNQRSPAVLALPTFPAGGFVVAWESEEPSGSNTDESIFARRFSAGLQAAGASVRVNGRVAGRQRFPSIANLAEGGYVVAYQSEQDGSGEGVFVQPFNATGAKVMEEQQVNVETRFNQGRPSVAGPIPSPAVAGDGAVWRTFVTVWHSEYEDGSVKSVFSRAARLGLRLPFTCDSEEVLSHYNIAINASCAPLNDCRSAMCACMGAASAANHTDWQCLRAPLPGLNCGLQPVCLLIYRQCVETASTRVTSANSLDCRTWAQMLRGSATAALATSTAYPTSTLAQACRATVCDVWQRANTRCPYTPGPVNAAVCVAPDPSIRAGDAAATPSPGSGAGTPGPTTTQAPTATAAPTPRPPSVTPTPSSAPSPLQRHVTAALLPIAACALVAIVAVA